LTPPNPSLRFPDWHDDVLIYRRPIHPASYIRSLTCLRAQITKILGYICQAVILIIGLPILFMWSISEMISVECWRACGPARRNPNRNPSKGIMFSIRSSNRRRLSLPGAQADKSRTLPSTALVPRRKARGFFDLPYEIREQ